MAGGDSSSSSTAREEGRASARLRKKQKLHQQEEEEKGANPLDPSFSDYDPKEGDYVFTRFQHPTLDLHMESPVGAMHNTNRIFPEEGFRMCNSANIVSVNIASSDYGYPLNVYGTIIARDSLDRKRVYLFQRAKDDCQNISSKNEPLVLTGPKRGLMIFDSIIFEVDLKAKDVNGRKVNDERVSKGLMEINGISRLSFPPKYKVQTEKLVSMHSTLDLNYTFVRKAVEGTVEMRILEAGPVDYFHGKIVARTSSFPCDIMLHDSKLAGMLTAGDGGVVQTARRVVSVSVDETLLLTVAVAAGGVRTVEFTPKHGSYDEEKITCDDYKMLVKVTWSIVHR
ncbi:hypothetical protein CFC21_020494 [Triticum aestivum]|uniref:DUF6598 domain-containing protein n=3 Tax=Triticum TaxID=4564 RepID=A0A9R1RG12_TRITD|nr:uncharacterized protein LOC123038725 [Triticum aestivum]KAF7005368.1 hypothetical protein CFC21_020494 [Triticum aestivum]VAH39960.1 unnamed protein product [Triticum turgidum subsp. durum]